MLARSSVFYPLWGLLVTLAVMLRWAGLSFQSHDMQDFLLPWFDYIVTHGRFAALSDNFSNYTPPYLYMMTAVSYLDGLVDRVVLIKSISFFFETAAAILIYRMVLRLRHDRRLAAISALLFLDLPTVILNGAVWGQCDIIYTTFLLAFVSALIEGRPFQAMVMFAIALSLKVQAIFLAPFLVYLLLAGVLPVSTVVAPPLVYGLLVLPAALIGRGWISLLTIYAGQSGFTHSLSASAPNFYEFFQGYLSEEGRSVASYAALALAGLASIALLAVLLRRRPALSPLFVIVSAIVWLALEPSLLPRMHERYFFPADVLAFVFAFLMPRAWWLAVLFQLGSALAYAPYLTRDWPAAPFVMSHGAQLGAVAMIAAVLGIFRYYFPPTPKALPG